MHRCPHGLPLSMVLSIRLTPYKGLKTILEQEARLCQVEEKGNYKEETMEKMQAQSNTITSFP